MNQICLFVIALFTIVSQQPLAIAQKTSVYSDTAGMKQEIESYLQRFSSPLTIPSSTKNEKNTIGDASSITLTSLGAVSSLWSWHRVRQITSQLNHEGSNQLSTVIEQLMAKFLPEELKPAEIKKSPIHSMNSGHFTQHRFESSAPQIERILNFGPKNNQWNISVLYQFKDDKWVSISEKASIVKGGTIEHFAVNRDYFTRLFSDHFRHTKDLENLSQLSEFATTQGIELKTLPEYINKSLPNLSKISNRFKVVRATGLGLIFTGLGLLTYLNMEEEPDDFEILLLQIHQQCWSQANNYDLGCATRLLQTKNQQQRLTVKLYSYIKDLQAL